MPGIAVAMIPISSDTRMVLTKIVTMTRPSRIPVAYSGGVSLESFSSWGPSALAGEWSLSLVEPGWRPSRSAFLLLSRSELDPIDSWDVLC
jgi:hypothetical protein